MSSPTSLCLRSSPTSLTRIIHLPAILLLLIAALAFSQPGFGQTFRKGQYIEPAYEGWRQNEDGTYNMMFGYHNENWEEELDVEIGDNNFFPPGDPDRGQPTHFLPRRNRFT